MDPNLGSAAPARSQAEYFARWSQLHGGVDPEKSWLVRGWLATAYALARPLTAIGMFPNVVTALGMAIAIGVPLCAELSVSQSQPLWLWLAVVGCAVSGLVDSLDGAVAVISGRTSPWGFVVDSVADRVSDLALLAALWLAGGSGVACAVAAGITVLQEYSRARAGAAGMSDVGVISVWERPTRIVVVAVFLGLAAWSPFGLTHSNWSNLGAWLTLGLSAVGCVQVLLTIRRTLR